MTSKTEVELSRGLASGTTELLLGTLRRYGRPVSLGELIDAGILSKSKGRQALDLLVLRHDVGWINVGSIHTSIEKRYYAVRHG